MPFDGTGTIPAIHRAMLAERLRNDTEWEWNFCNTAGCAIGMASVMFRGRDLHIHLSDFLGLTVKQYGDIFGFINTENNEREGHDPEWAPFYQMDRTRVTPAMVADALENIE